LRWSTSIAVDIDALNIFTVLADVGVWMNRRHLLLGELPTVTWWELLLHCGSALVLRRLRMRSSGVPPA
jgi:hypothetical protein